MLPAKRLGRIFGALLEEGRPRTLRGAACRETAGRRPSETVRSGDSQVRACTVAVATRGSGPLGRPRAPSTCVEPAVPVAEPLPHGRE